MKKFWQSLLAIFTFGAGLARRAPNFLTQAIEWQFKNFFALVNLIKVETSAYEPLPDSAYPLDGSFRYSAEVFRRKYEFMLYYFVFFVVIWTADNGFWHLCAFMFVFGELAIFFLRPFFSSTISAVRYVFAGIFLVAIEINTTRRLCEFGDYHLIEFIHNFTGGAVSNIWMSWLVNSLVDIHTLVSFYFLYFTSLVLPYFLETLIIFLPLLGAAILSLFGYLIGYVYAGFLASTCIAIVAISAWYLWLIYPFTKSALISFVGQSPQLVSVRRSPSASGTFDVIANTQEIVVQTDLSGNMNYLAMKGSSNFNLSVDFGSFIDTPSFYGGFEFVLDPISIIMVVTISTISSLVHFYSLVYMRADPHSIRFFIYLSVFTFFMLILVMAGNLIMLYVGWEGVGLASYLLISFWYTRAAAVKAATKAILVNKIGDMFLISATAVLTYYSKGSTTISTLPYYLFDHPTAANAIIGGMSGVDLAALMLVIAAFVKSAQLFFHTWLADAMEGPTPVSALLHAATMVTAGVYLVIRFSHLIELSRPAKYVLFFGGLVTIIFSSLVALTQYDIKKIIAYSTCSQLGLMFFSCGLSGYDFALYHFFNHAFFKCLLFLLAGAIIHQLGNEQDIRKMGGLASKMPFTFIFFSIASFSLVGIPGFSGALSKDLILHLAIVTGVNSYNFIVLVFLFLTNIIIYLTMAYAARLLYYIFFNKSNYRKNTFRPGLVDPIAAEPVYGAVFTILAFFSIFGGAYFKNLFIVGSSFFNIQGEIACYTDFHHLAATNDSYQSVIFLLTLHAALVGFIFIIYNNSYRASLSKSAADVLRFTPAYAFFCFLNRKCYFDEVYTLFIIRPILNLSYIFNYIEENLFNFFTFGLWRALHWPYLFRFNTTRLGLVEHMFFSTFGLIILTALSYYLTF